MNTSRYVLTLALLVAAAPAVPAQLGGEGAQRVTLRSQIKHSDPEKAFVRIEPPMRRPGARATVSNHTLRFGGYRFDSDADLLDVPHAHGSRSQIKDLGPLDWSEVFDVPFLYASQTPHPGGMRIDYGGGQRARISPENVLAEAVEGHLYLVHFKDDDSDFYLMFRVESLKPNDECTISWKYVPSPEP